MSKIWVQLKLPDEDVNKINDCVNNKSAAKRGGKIANLTKSELEKETGNDVLSKNIL